MLAYRSRPLALLREIAAFSRYTLLRLRFRALPAGRVFVYSGGRIDVGPQAKIMFGSSVRFLEDFTGNLYGEVKIGSRVCFNRGCYVSALHSVQIGDNCMFGEGVSIHDENHVWEQGPTPFARHEFVVEPVVIGNNVWVGAKATILQGVRIGDGSIIGANAVVTRDIPPNSVAVGIPAKVIRHV